MLFTMNPCTFMLAWVTLTMQVRASNNVLESGYWEMKPFIFKDKNGNMSGIFHEVFVRGHIYCSSNESSMSVGFHPNGFFPSRVTFRQFLDDLAHPKTKRKNQRLLKGFDKTRLVLGPIIAPTDPLWADNHGFRMYQLATSDKLAVIVPRNEIRLTTKIIEGLRSCRPMLLIVLLSSIIYCVAIWLIERPLNSHYPKSFISGFWSTFWWSIVSMTTVGYGDLVPKTPFGRLIALGWLFFGVLSCCLMTARMTDAVNSVDHISIENMPVAVLQDSHEMKIVEHDYKGKVVPVPSYEEVFRKVRYGEAYAGVMLDMVAAWHQDEMHRKNEELDGSSLAIVKSIYGNTRIMVMMSDDVNEGVKKLLRCMHQYRQEIYGFSTDLFNRYLFFETVHIEDNVLNLFTQDEVIRTLTIFIGVLIILGIAYDSYVLFRHRKEGKPDVYRYVRWFFGRDVLPDSNYGVLVEGNDCEQSGTVSCGKYRLKNSDKNEKVVFQL